MRAPLSYYGGKARIASKIVPYIHRIPHTVYCEPFCGGLAVLYAKGQYDRGNRDYYREVINDLNKNLITFWRVAREQPEGLARWLDLTPYSQEEYRESLKIYREPEQHSELKVAWATYIQCNMSFANKVAAGWAFQVINPNSPAIWQSRSSTLPECFERLKKVYIACEDALSLIKSTDSPHTLHYVDPPYPGTEQGHYSGYALDDYQQLCNLLDESEGSYILSNYYQEIAPKSAQQCIEIEATMSAANGKDRADMDCKRIEKLWICDRSSGMREDLAKVAQIPDKSRYQQVGLFE